MDKPIVIHALSSKARFCPRTAKIIGRTIGRKDDASDDLRKAFLELLRSSLNIARAASKALREEEYNRIAKREE